MFSSKDLSRKCKTKSPKSVIFTPSRRRVSFPKSTSSQSVS